MNAIVSEVKCAHCTYINVNEAVRLKVTLRFICAKYHIRVENPTVWMTEGFSSDRQTTFKYINKAINFETIKGSTL